MNTQDAAEVCEAVLIAILSAIAAEAICWGFEKLRERFDPKKEEAA